MPAARRTDGHGTACAGGRAHGPGQIEPARVGAAQAVEQRRGHREIDDQDRHDGLAGKAVAEPQDQERREREHRDGLAEHEDRQQPWLQRRQERHQQRAGAPDQHAAREAEQDLEERYPGMVEQQRRGAYQRPATAVGGGSRNAGTPVAHTRPCQRRRRPSRTRSGRGLLKRRRRAHRPGAPAGRPAARAGRGRGDRAAARRRPRSRPRCAPDGRSSPGCGGPDAAPRVDRG